VKILCVIPVRGGSKGIPGKNSKLIAGLPLVAWTILQARDANFELDVLVSTDSPELAKISSSFGADVPFLRPAELATDLAATEPVMQHAIDFRASLNAKPDAIMLLQATSPIRFLGTIDAAIKQFIEQGLDSLVGVVAQTPFLWRQNPETHPLYDTQARPRRQDLSASEMFYRETGSLYITRTSSFEESANRICQKTGIFVMREAEGVDIDTEVDFAIAEQLLKKYKNEIIRDGAAD
jgi:N-acylneuraminate cytidylyltransferase